MDKLQRVIRAVLDAMPGAAIKDASEIAQIIAIQLPGTKVSLAQHLVTEGLINRRRNMPLEQRSPRLSRRVPVRFLQHVLSRLEQFLGSVRLCHHSMLSRWRHGPYQARRLRDHE